jgi:hypothetical protein
MPLHRTATVLNISINHFILEFSLEKRRRMFFLQRLISSSRLNANSTKYAQVVILLLQAIMAVQKGGQ